MTPFFPVSATGRAFCHALVLALLCAPLPAAAAGFLIHENSTASVASAYAGTGSRADAPSTVFSNPAGMTHLGAGGFEAGAVGVLMSTTFSGSARQGGVPLAGTNGGDSGRNALLPNLYGVVRLTDDLTAGLAVTVPFGNANEYDSNWIGRYLGTKTAAMSTDINPAIAWRINDTWSVGAGLSAQYLKLDVSSAINQSAIFGVAVPDATYRFKAHDWAVGFNGGVLADFGDTRVGLTYRSGVDHQIDGRLDFTGVAPILGLVSGPASAKARLPATTGLSVTTMLDPDLSVSADVQFAQWSVFKDVTIQSANTPFVNVENYRDSWMVSVGGEYRVDEQWALKMGIAFDQTPVVSRYRAVSLPDTDRYLLGMGASYKLSDTMTVEAAYEHSFTFNKPNMNTSLNASDPITHAAVLNGRFDVTVDVVALSFRYAL